MAPARFYQTFGWLTIIEEKAASATMTSAVNADVPREPSSIMLELDNLLQHTVDLNMLGDIAFRKRTVPRKTW